MPIEGDVVPLKMVHQLPVISLRINEQGPYDLLLDTGTESTLVDQALARQLHLVTSERTNLISPNGVHPVGRALTEEVIVGHKKLANVEFLVDDLRELHSLSPSLRGILGQNILTQFSFLIDYRHHKVDLEASVEEQAGVRIPFEFQDGRIMLKATLPGSQELRLQLDSGATNLLLFRHGPTASLPGMESAFLSTNQDTTAIYQARLPELRLGPTVLRALQVGLMFVDDRPSQRTEDNHHAPPPIDGLLPTGIFDTIYFDFAQNFIAVTGKKITAQALHH